MTRPCVRCGREIGEIARFCVCVFPLVESRIQWGDDTLWSFLFGWGQSERLPTLSPDHESVPYFPERGSRVVRREARGERGLWSGGVPRPSGSAILRFTNLLRGESAIQTWHHAKATGDDLGRIAHLAALFLEWLERMERDERERAVSDPSSRIAP